MTISVDHHRAGERSTTKSIELALSVLRGRGIAPDQIDQLDCELKTAAFPLQALRQRYLDGRLSEADYQEVVGELLSLSRFSLIHAADVDPEFVRSVPIRFAREHRMIGLKLRSVSRLIVIADPETIPAIDHVSALLRAPVEIALGPSEVILRSLHDAYSLLDADYTQILQEATSHEEIRTETGDGDLLDTASRAPVIKLVSTILFDAVKRFASDVHVQPFPDHVQVRYRIDGVLYDYLQIPANMLDEVISRIKVIGRMDIAEKRISQDGRTTVTIGDRSVDLRISIIPTCYGERAVLRLLDKSARLYELAELGMAPEERTRFEEIIQRTHGIILVTGPTGSGKTTTLYAALQRLDSTERNILTLEDPIEYQLAGISQMQVSRKKGMTFATGLRSVLRQDPDVIMVGEIRDEETARMAIQSSLTGHLVFSTLHTNNAAGAVSRLLDLGMEPHLVASSLLASMAQRLLRIVCAACSVERELTAKDIRVLGLPVVHLGSRVREAIGCDKCGKTGYAGRKGIFELFILNESARELIMQKCKASALEADAVAGGMKTLRQDAVRKLLSG